MTVRQDLEAAKALIDTPEKWGKGEYVSSNGCLCTFGAVLVARGNNPDEDEDVSEADWALVSALPDDAKTRDGILGDVIDFNDDETTTHADIMALFDRAINSAALDELRKPVDEVRE